MPPFILASRRRPIAWLACAVSLAHGLALSQWAHSALGTGHRQQVQHAPPVHVLLVPASRPAKATEAAVATRRIADSVAHLRGDLPEAGAQRADTGNPAARQADDLAKAHYLPNDTLDRGALPRSAPDTGLLEGLALSGLPMRLRLFVDAHGQVTEVQSLQASEQDADAVERLRAMFMATAFIPGRLASRDVQAYLDIELSLAPESVVTAARSDPGALPVAAH